ncbi:MAG: GPH family glycoside/pentoside/hexuronide:cation symporter, partial [Cellvibrionaceae bacterium]
FAYGFMAFPLAAAFIALQVIIPTHYAETTALSLSTIGGIILLARLWDTITDPLVGYLSDKTPEHLGRRRLWILVSIPLILISVFLLFNPSTTADATYLLTWTLAIYIAGTMAIIPMNAWGAELSNDYHQRNRVTGTRAVFGLSGALAALSIPVILGESNSDNMTDTLHAISWLVGLTLIAASALLFFVPDRHSVALPPNQFKSALTLLKQPSPFRRLLVSFLSNSIANAIPATLFLFYVTYVLQSSDKAGLLLFTYFLCSIISIPFWMKLAKKWDKHKTWCVSIIVACCFFAWTPFLDSDSFWLYFLIVVATGFTTGCDLMIPSSMNGDLVEWDAKTSGYRRPAIFFALWGTTTKLAFALAIGIAFPLLDFFDFSANAENSSSALNALAWMYGLPTILFKIIALWSMKGYPLTEKEYGSLLNSQQPSTTN